MRVKHFLEISLVELNGRFVEPRRPIVVHGLALIESIAYGYFGVVGNAGLAFLNLDEVDFQWPADDYNAYTKSSFAVGAVLRRALQQKTGSRCGIALHGREELSGETELTAGLVNRIARFRFLPTLDRGCLLRPHGEVRSGRSKQ